MSATEVRQHEPVDAVVERLNDPTVAASLVTILDNIELLSMLVLGLGELVARSETVMDAVSDGVREFKVARGEAEAAGRPSIADLAELSAQLSAATPALRRVLDSPMVDPATIDALGMLSAATATGAERARADETRVAGLRGALRSLRDPEVQRGLGVVIEISRALGRQTASTDDRQDPTRKEVE